MTTQSQNFYLLSDEVLVALPFNLFRKLVDLSGGDRYSFSFHDSIAKLHLFYGSDLAASISEVENWMWTKGGAKCLIIWECGGRYGNIDSVSAGRLNEGSIHPALRLICSQPGAV